MAVQIYLVLQHRSHVHVALCFHKLPCLFQPPHLLQTPDQDEHLCFEMLLLSHPNIQLDHCINFLALLGGWGKMVLFTEVLLGTHLQAQVFRLHAGLELPLLWSWLTAIGLHPFLFTLFGFSQLKLTSDFIGSWQDLGSSPTSILF